MVIKDEARAKQILQNISYYRLSGYWYPLLADKQRHLFKSGSTFERAYNLYKFDSELRKMILSEIEKIEVAVRTQLAYVMSQNYGGWWFQDTALFSNPARLAKTISNMDEELGRSGNLNSGRCKRQIAKYFGVADTVMVSWLHAMTYIRNVCAHHSRLWNRTLGISPIMPRRTANPFVSLPAKGTRHVYFILAIIQYWLNIVNPSNTFKTKIMALLSKYPAIDISAMGFPSNWEKEAFWL